MALRSPQERKEILRRVITEAETLKENVNEKTIKTLELCMEKADTINAETTIDEKINNQEEVLLDSEMVNISSKVLKHCTRSLTKGIRSYNYAEFAEKLVLYVQRLPDTELELPNWSLLEPQIIKHFYRTPTYNPLTGLLRPIENKEVTKRRTIVRDAQAPLKRPENVVTVDKEEEGLEQTTLIKNFITRYYKTHRKPLDFFHLVLHPTDFGKTIENILQISFLARDGNIKITKNNMGILMVQPSSKEAVAQVKKSEQNINTQNVIYLNMEQWKTLKDAYRLERPMIEFSTNT